MKKRFAGKFAIYLAILFGGAFVAIVASEAAQHFALVKSPLGVRGYINGVVVACATWWMMAAMLPEQEDDPHA